MKAAEKYAKHLFAKHAHAVWTTKHGGAARIVSKTCVCGWTFSGSYGEAEQECKKHLHENR